MKIYNQGIFAILILTSSCINATISPGRNKSNKTLLQTGPSENNVFVKKLIDKEPYAKDIIIHSASYYKLTDIKNFNGTVLGYITPWNSQGYDTAKLFINKFDIISPVWFQIIPVRDGYNISGSQDIDLKFINHLKLKGRKIFPRIIFDKFGVRDFNLIFTEKHAREKIANKIVSLCVENGFSGIVFEFWRQISEIVNQKVLINFIINIVDVLEQHNLKCILPIPPVRTGEADIFGQTHINKLYKKVYAFSLMTYDYSNVHRPGANAPLHWIRECIETIVPTNGHDVENKRKKILMGINMYGYDYTPNGGGPILSNKYLELLSHVKKRLSFDAHDVENYFELRIPTGRHFVFYPTLYSINERIKLAQELGVGISIWELGQGLNYFYDLF